MTILTISSQVLYGHVGNSVADFALKRLGHSVISVPTVLLSNHKGYEDAVGEIFGPDLLRDFFAALERRGVLDQLTAVQTGFIATAGQAETVFDFLQQLRAGKPDLPIIVDPVMGDRGRLYVDPALVSVYRARVPALASLITPNLFEAMTLVGGQIDTAEDLVAGLRSLGVQSGLVTSAEDLIGAAGQRAILTFERVSTPEVRIHPHLAFEREPNGVGDFVSALSTALLGQEPLADMAERIQRSLLTLLEETRALGGRELALVQAQDAWVRAIKA